MLPTALLPHDIFVFASNHPLFLLLVAGVFLDVVIVVFGFDCGVLVLDLVLLLLFLLSLLVLGCAGRPAAANTSCSLGCGALLPCTGFAACDLERAKTICLYSFVGRAPAH